MKDPFTLPDKKGQFVQPNDGDSLGNIYMTYGIDLEKNKGRISVSEQVKKLVNSVDNADFGGYAAAIGAYSTDGINGKIFAVSNKAFSADIADPLGTWSEESVGSEPDSSSTRMDGVFFDGLFLVSESDNIKAWNGTTWVSWWQGTLGQSALTGSGDRHLLEVGPDGNLYILDDGNKVYRVTPTSTITLTGDGTLDFSATNYELTTLVSNSTRMWIGTWDKTGDEAVIIEWDLSPGSATANKLHKTGARRVNCIAIWNDTPIAILSNGRAKYFNGSTFVDFDNSMQFPVSNQYELSANFVHPNGWAIMDNLPHFLVTGRTDNATELTAIRQGSYRMASGVWCLDPSIGLYHRYALGTGLTPQEDYGKMQASDVGALYSLQNSESKFLASYRYYSDDQTAERSTLVYHDASNTQSARGFLMTSFIYSLREKLKTLETFHKKLATGEKMRVFYRNEIDESLAQEGVWLSTTQLNIVGTNLGVEENYVAFIKTGPGAGQLLRVESVTESEAVTSITFKDANSFAVLNEISAVDLLNFKYMGEITSTTKDMDSLTIPSLEHRRKTQFLLEFQQVAGNTMELDYCIIS